MGKLKKIGIIIGVILILLIGIPFTIGFLSGSSESVTPTGQMTAVQDTQTEKQTVSQKPVDQKYLNVSYDELVRNNENYIGHTVSFRGEVWSISNEVFSDEDEYKLIVLVKPSDNTFLDYDYSDKIVVNYKGQRLLEKDIIEFQGAVVGIDSFWDFPEVNADVLQVKIKSGDRKDQDSEIKKSIIVDETQDRRLIVLTFEKVEFTDEYTRVYLTLFNNRTREAVSFSTYASKATQGQKQFDTKYVYDQSSPQFSSDILPQIEDDGVVYFEPLDYNMPNATFLFTVYTDYYDPYLFRFNVDLSK